MKGFTRTEAGVDHFIGDGGEMTPGKSGDEQTLVAGNLRTFAARLRACLEGHA